MTAADVKIPPDWLRTPAHETRSQLLDARRVDRREWALARSPGEAQDRRFARSETLFRDWFRRTGVFEPAAPATAAESGGGTSATRSAMLEKRQAARRAASLLFEPQEIERLADRPRARDLREWWKQRDGYVEDPLSLVGDSVHVELMHRRGRVVGCDQDVASSHGGWSVEEDGARLQRSRRKQQQVADKVTRVRHPVPDAYLGAEAAAAAAAIRRADDLYAQEPPVGRASGFGGLADASAWSLPISPIKGIKPARQSRALREGVFADGLAQRSLLEQLKTAAAALPAVDSPSPPMLSPLTRQCQNQHASAASGGDHGPSVRCGGFL